MPKQVRHLTVQSFNARLQKEHRRRAREFVTRRQRIAATLFHVRTIQRTPRDTGTLQASWNLKTGSPDLSRKPRGNYSTPNESAVAAKLGRLRPYQAIYSTNSQPYAPVVEFGLYPKPGGPKTSGGFSIQAPRGMARITFAELKATILPRISIKRLELETGLT